MSNRSLQLEIIAPDGPLFQGQAEMVLIPGEDGDLGILPQHIPTIVALRPGTALLYDKNKIIKRFFLSGGFADITETALTVLATDAHDLAQLDRKQVEKEITERREDLKTIKDETEKKVIAQQLAVANAKWQALNQQVYS